MNRSCLLVFSLFILLSLSPFVPAQKKDGPAPLAENASLQETQKWLKKAINKYFEFHVNSIYFTVSDLKFDGCALSYTVTREANSYSRVPGFSITMTDGAIKSYSFNLGEYDPGNVIIKNNEAEEIKTLVLVRPAQGDEPKEAAVAPAALNFDTMTVKAGAAEPVKLAIARAITLCRSNNAVMK